jgi:tetratricopeptide (TPR) repeat protein
MEEDFENSGCDASDKRLLTMQRLAPAVLILATILTFLPAFRNGFVYDDHFQLERNPYIREFRHLDILLTKEVWHFSPRTQSNNYRPLHMISYLLIYKMFSLNPLAYHAIAVMIYLATVLVLWQIYKLFVAPLPAFAGSILFATYPVHVENVAWIGGYPDLLCALFLMISFYLYRKEKIIFSLLSFLFALFSKEIALVFPLFVIADHVFFRSRENKRVLHWFVGSVLLTIGYAALRMYSLGSFLRLNSSAIEPLSVLHSGAAFAGLYLGKLLFPFQLNAFYHFELPLSLAVSWSGILILFCSLILLYIFRKNQLFVFGFLWFILFLTPALLLKEVSPVLFAERYLYLPSAGFILAILSISSNRVLPVLLIAISVLLAGVSFSRSKVWNDDLTLWKDTIEKSPRSVTVNYNLATAYLKEKEYEQAAIYYRSATALDPSRADSFYNLALCEYNLGQKQLAAQSLQKFLKHSPPDHPYRRDAEQKLRQLAP